MVQEIFKIALHLSDQHVLYVTITGKCARFQLFNLETNFLENESFFKKSWIAIFQSKLLRFKMQDFHTKIPYQKPILRQIEREIQSGPITKNGVLRVRTSYKWLIRCTN